MASEFKITDDKLASPTAFSGLVGGVAFELRVAAAAAVFAVLAVPALPPDVRAGEAGAITRIKMSLTELRQLGISFGASGRFPNSCAHTGDGAMSLSNEIVAHFKARGFTVTSLCLGLGSNLRFDPQTGRQLPVAYLPDLAGGQLSPEMPLNLPDCFKRALPFFDCGTKYDFFAGILSRPEESRPPGDAGERQRDALYVSFIQQHRISGGVFYDFNNTQSLPGHRWGYQGRDVTQLYFAGGSAIKRVVASRDLPRGYGYSLNCCEGDDPEPEAVSLSTYRKTQDVWALWTDQR